MPFSPPGTASSISSSTSLIRSLSFFAIQSFAAAWACLPLRDMAVPAIISGTRPLAL